MHDDTLYKTSNKPYSYSFYLKSSTTFSLKMASTGAGQSRPSMRRKSSAQTLLNSFKSNASNNPGPPPTAPPTQLSMQIPPAPTYNGGTSTPTTASQREWDTQSMKSDSVASTTAPLNANGSPALPQGASLESLRDLTMKRMITLTYLRNVHEGYA